MAERQEKKNFTTVMIQSLPWSFTEETMLREIDALCGQASYDFFYMPWNMKRDTSSGYAFVNFTKPADALKCATQLTGHKFESDSKTIKPCIVLPANVQGLKSNLEFYRNRVVCASDNLHAPMVFENGKRIDFREATDRLCGVTADLPGSNAPVKRDPGNAGQSEGHTLHAGYPASIPSTPLTGEDEIKNLLEFVCKHPEWHATAMQNVDEMKKLRNQRPRSGQHTKAGSSDDKKDSNRQ